MTLNKFCPVAQGEYYNNKFPRKSQHFFPVFLKFFLLFVQLQHIAVHNRFAYNICNSVSSHHLSNFKLLFYTIKTGIAAQRFLLLQSLLSNYLVLFIYEYHISPHTSLSCSQGMAQRPMFFLSLQHFSRCITAPILPDMFLHPHVQPVKLSVAYLLIQIRNL